MAPNQSVEELVKRAQTGDRDAFESLVARYEGSLLARVRHRMGARLRECVEVEDVVQETFLKAFHSIERLCWQGEKEFLHWLGGIAENHLLDLADRHDRRRVLRLERDVRDGSLSPSVGLRREERFERLEDALERLAPEHRQVILLVRVEGLPVKDVAVRMNRSPNATAQLLRRALRSLRETFGHTESLGLPPRRLDEGARDGR